MPTLFCLVEFSDGSHAIMPYWFVVECHCPAADRLDELVEAHQQAQQAKLVDYPAHRAN